MRTIDRLVEDIFKEEYYQNLFEKGIKLSAETNIGKKTYDNYFSDKELSDILRFADVLSNSDNAKARNNAYQIVTNLNKVYRDKPLYKTTSKAVYSKLGNFPAIQFLEKNNDSAISLPLLRLVELEAKKTLQRVPFNDDGFVFTDVQYQLYSQLKDSHEFSFSGPTSMGKSFIIKTFIRGVMMNTPPENLVIIVPTRALINQFAIDLKKELEEALIEYRYRILTNSSIGDLVEEIPHHYIFILTPERLISYLSQEGNPPIGFVFVDEAHKLAQNSDLRSVTTYTAIERLIKKFGNVKLYFSSPNVSNPEVFLNLFKRVSQERTFKTNESPVSQNLFFIDLNEKKIEIIQANQFYEISSNAVLDRIESTTDLIKKLGKNKNNLVYCNSKSSTIESANNFAKKASNEIDKKEISDAIKQISEYIHPEYYLTELLRKGVAFHYGKLPQLIRNLVEDLYKKEEIRNVFCTSTLLEGVNMPTQNIFILNNMNGIKPLAPIDFWNLSGRAGRLTKELYGNIFCVQHEGCDWKDKNVLVKSDIELKPTVTQKVDRNLKKIEKILKEKDVSGTITEKSILKYIANIISVDTLEIESKYKSPLIAQLIEKNKKAIIDLAKERVKGYQIPSEILGTNQSIDLKIQDEVYKVLKVIYKEGGEIKLPNNNIKYTVVLEILEKMHQMYKWENAEKPLQNKNRLRYYAMIMNQWINGLSLSQIIRQSLEFQDGNRSKIHDGYVDKMPNYVEFDRSNVRHVNIVIEDIIEDIEYVLRFLFEKYFNHYFIVAEKVLGVGKAGENWATLLEYGTQNRIVIALQNLGLSRHTAIKINKEFRSFLKIQDGKLVSVNKAGVLSRLKNGSIEYQEVFNIL